MELTQDVKKFIAEHKNLLKQNDLRGFYDCMYENDDLFGWAVDISMMTEFFVSKGIDVLDIFSKEKEIPPCCFYTLDCIGPVLDLRNFTDIKLRAISFGGCQKLEIVHLPKGVKIEGRSPFDECYHLTDIHFHGLPSEIMDPDLFQMSSLQRCTFYNCTEEELSEWATEINGLHESLDDLFYQVELIFK